MSVTNNSHNATIELGGKPRTLKFNMKSTKLLERSTGKPLKTITEDLGNLSLTVLTDCVWAGLQYDDPSLTHANIDKWLEAYLEKGRGITEVFLAVQGAMFNSGLFKAAPDDAESEGNAQTTPASGS